MGMGPEMSVLLMVFLELSLVKVLDLSAFTPLFLLELKVNFRKLLSVLCSEAETG